MANIKHFSDLGGQTIELTGSIYGMPNAEFAARFPGVKGKRYDSFSMFVGRAAGREWPVTRMVEYKAFARRHECDDRCMYATGRIMRCECACGGKNHGKGGFSLTCSAA